MIDSARLPDGSEQEIVEDRQQDEGEESHDKEVGEQDVVPGVGHWQPEVGGTDGGSVSADPGHGGVDKARLQLHEARNVPEQSRKDDRDYVEIARKCGQEVSEIFIHKTLTLSTALARRVHTFDGEWCWDQALAYANIKTYEPLGNLWIFDK